MQLVCWLMELLGPWSEIHDNIWTCLVEVPHWGYGPLEADRSREIVLAEVREYGRIAEAIPGLCKILSGHARRRVFIPAHVVLPALLVIDKNICDWLSSG